MRITKEKANFEEYSERMHNSFSNKAVIIPYIVGANVVDFGAGTGVLSEMIKEVRPESQIIAVDNDYMMRLKLYQVPEIDFVWGSLEDILTPVDTIVFNSVLHEVESYSELPLEATNNYYSSREDPGEVSYSGDLANLLVQANALIRKGGRIIIRDGFIDSSKQNMSVRVLNGFDVEDYIKRYKWADTLNVFGNRVQGEFNQMKEFLNKLTWGSESLPREIQEQINFLSRGQWVRLIEWAGFSVVEYKTYTQPSYFHYLQQVAELDQIWDTHVLIVAEKE